MPATLTYLEKHDDNAVTNFSFDITGGSAKAYYHFTVRDQNTSLQDVIQDILGYTNPYPSTQGLQRKIPLSHPRYPYLYASKISSLVGLGVASATVVQPTQPTNPQIGFNPIAPFEQFQTYEVGVEFTSRPYPILSDGIVPSSISGKWYTKTGIANPFTYAGEWARYTDYELAIQDNTIQGSTGGFSLVRNGGDPDAGFITFNSPPWMWLPDQMLKITWYQVPRRFLTSKNSFITNRNWRGRINQNAWWDWPAGSLLYLGYNYKKYTPPTMDIETIIAPFTPPGVTITNTLRYAQLCDIELNFLLTNRQLSGSLGASITNLNNVAAGHNLQPDISKLQFLYTVMNPSAVYPPTTPPAPTPPPSVQNSPPWASFPVEALFSDPDVTGGPTTGGDI